MRTVSADYFRAIGFRFATDEFFTEADARIALPVMRWLSSSLSEHYSESQPVPVLIINETMARTFFPNEEPLGKRLPHRRSPWLTIVGVVGDIHHTGLNAKPNPEMYLSDLQEPQGAMAVMAQTSADPLALAGPVARACCGRR